MAETIFVAIWTHKHGTDVKAFRSKAGAENWRQEIAQDNWDDETRGMPQQPSKPEEPAELADRYFEMLADRGGNAEYFDVEEVALED